MTILSRIVILQRHLCSVWRVILLLGQGVFILACWYWGVSDRREWETPSRSQGGALRLSLDIAEYFHLLTLILKFLRQKHFQLGGYQRVPSLFGKSDRGPACTVKGNPGKTDLAWTRRQLVICCFKLRSKQCRLGLRVGFWFLLILLMASNCVQAHVPYRDSMMTSVLRDSLGGNCQLLRKQNWSTGLKLLKFFSHSTSWIWSCHIFDSKVSDIMLVGHVALHALQRQNHYGWLHRGRSSLAKLNT